MLPACDIIFMCPIRPMRAGIRSGHMAWSGGTKNENYYVYFPHSEVKMHLMYVAYFERKKKKKRDNKQRIKYFLSSSECLAYCRICFAPTTISFFFFFVITGGASRGVRPFISVSGTSYAHISGSALPCSTPPRLHRPLQQAGLSSFSTAVFGFRKWLIPHGCLCGWGPECTSVPRASQEDFLWELVLRLRCGTPHEATHLLEYPLLLHCRRHFPLIYRYKIPDHSADVINTLLLYLSGFFRYLCSTWGLILLDSLHFNTSAVSTPYIIKTG